MEPISGMISGAVHTPSTVSGVKEPPKVPQLEEQTQGNPIAPARDEYVPEEKQEPAGRYWLGKDEDGKPKIYFDDPEQASDAPEKQEELPDADGPEQKASGDKAERCTCNTDRVDREIEALKAKQEALERQLHSETDDLKIKELEQKLARAESELRQKDNDTYRRQHAVFS